jgi:hypothetical protein
MPFVTFRGELMSDRANLLRRKAAPLHDEAKSRVYYHGTSSEKAAQAILDSRSQHDEPYYEAHPGGNQFDNTAVSVGNSDFRILRSTDIGPRLTLIDL